MKQNNTPAPAFEYSNTVIGALADAFGKSISTIERWIREEDDRLTSDKAREVYARIGQQA